MDPLELLYEADGLPSFELPARLRELYAGSVGFERPRVITNFVSSLDGVVAVPAVEGSARKIARESEQDGFVMALLRACADAVLIGAGTLQASPRSVWKVEGPFKEGAADFAELRRALGLPEQPRLVVATGSGLVDVLHPAFERGALVVTSSGGATNLEGRLPEASEIVVVGSEERLDMAAVVAALHERELALVLSEAGPHLFGAMLRAGVVDELFLCVSPLLAGRIGDSIRFGLVEDAELLPDQPVNATLLSVRRGGEHLFLRYLLGAAAG